MTTEEHVHQFGQWSPWSKVGFDLFHRQRECECGAVEDESTNNPREAGFAVPGAPETDEDDEAAYNKELERAANRPRVVHVPPVERQPVSSGISEDRLREIFREELSLALGPRIILCGIGVSSDSLIRDSHCELPVNHMGLHKDSRGAWRCPWCNRDSFQGHAEGCPAGNSAGATP